MELKLTQATAPVKLIVINTINQSSAQQVINKFPCKSGCNSCCYRLLKLSIAEAMVIYSYLQESDQWESVKKKAKEQLPISKNSDPISWLKMRISCPVLNDDTKNCRAYKVRPPFCSTHFVKSKAEVCDPWYTGNDGYEPAFFEEIYMRAKSRIFDSTDSIMAVELPIQVALLFAEKVSIKSGLSYDQVIRMISSEF